MALGLNYICSLYAKEMERTSALIVEGNQALLKLGDDCAGLCNELNFEHKQALHKLQKVFMVSKKPYEGFRINVFSALLALIHLD